MGNGCEKCCSNADDPSEFYDNPNSNKDPLQSLMNRQSGAIRGVGGSREFKGSNQNSYLASQGLQPVVTRSGQFRNGILSAQGSDQNIDVMKLIRLQALVRGFIARRRFNRELTNFSKTNGVYFRQEEFYETVRRGEQFNQNGQVEMVEYQYQCSPGAFYKGQMKGGFRHGLGEMTWPDGAQYKGSWKEGYACGKGKFTHVDGDIYDGEWMNNKCNGFGTYKNKQGASYEGYWVDDIQQGQGIEVWPEGSRYEGNYLKGKKHGFGKYRWADGAVYEGDWKDNKINGVGMYIWKDGRKYHGQWNDNDMHGIGVYRYNDGVEYHGQYADDKKQGYGLYFWTDGRKYEGWWYKGKQHGLGIYIDPTKNKLRYGLWEFGKRVTWFDENEKLQIERGLMRYEEKFASVDSGNFVVDNATFAKPPTFDKELTAIKSKFKLN